MNDVSLLDGEREDVPAGPIVLQKMSPRHRQAMSLLAQGVPRQTIAAACDYTPEYITWLSKQPVCQDYLKDMCDFTQTRYDALFEKTADVISDAMHTGSEKARLQAAKLALEVSGRIGPGRAQGRDSADSDRLEKLAERLVDLLAQKRGPVTLQGTATIVKE